jgi:hypothetical protein
VALKDEHDEGGQDEGAAEDDGTNLPGHLTLAGSRVDPLHDSKDIDRRYNIEDLEYDVPWQSLDKKVEVPGAEDKGVENLRDEGDTLSASVAMDGEDEDAFGEGVGQVAQNSEEL